MFIYTSVILLTLLYCLQIIKRPKSAVLTSVLMLTISISLPISLGYNFIVKLLILVAELRCILSRYTKMTKKKFYALLLLIVFMLIQLLICINNQSTDYSIEDFVTSAASFIIGVLFFYFEWEENERIEILKYLSFMATLCVLFGVIQYYGFVSSTGRIISSAKIQHLSFFSGFGIITSGILYEKYGFKRFLYWMFINFAISMLTRMRGGAIFAVICISPYIISYLRKLNFNRIIKSTILIVVAAPFFISTIRALLARTFVDGELNTSNRFLIWNRLLDYSKDYRALGMGLGSIKTLPDSITGHNFVSPHNEYIRFLVETGVVGIIIILMILMILWKQVLVKSEGVRKKYLITLLIGMAVFSFTDNTISAIEFWAPVNMIVAIMCNSVNDTYVNFKDTQNKRGKYA